MSQQWTECPDCNGDGGEYIVDILTFQKCKRCGGKGKVECDERSIRKDESTGSGAD